VISLSSYNIASALNGRLRVQFENPSDTPSCVELRRKKIQEMYADALEGGPMEDEAWQTTPLYGLCAFLLWALGSDDWQEYRGYDFSHPRLPDMPRSGEYRYKLSEALVLLNGQKLPYEKELTPEARKKLEEITSSPTWGIWADVHPDATSEEFVEMLRAGKV
jgi:hypothetical protein